MIQNYPFVSVIIPTFNRARYISKSIDSVLNQTYKNFEVIVVDDGSTDNTENVIKKYGNQVQYCYKKNGGVASARNLGIKSAKGTYIAFLDSDDFWEKDKLRLQMELAGSEPDVGLVYSDIYIFNEHGIIETKKERVKNFHRGYVFKELFVKPFIPTCSVIAKKECFEDVGLFDEKFNGGEDGDMWLRISQKYQIDYIDRSLANFREDTEGSLGKNQIKMLKDAIEYRKKALREKPELVKVFYLDARKTMARLHCRLGEVYSDNRKYQEAKISFFKSIRYYPLYANQYISLILLFLKNAKIF